MYASDITHRKRAETVFRNLQLQKEWFASGGTIRILGQKGGNDYSYMNEIQEGCLSDTCYIIDVPINPTSGDGPMTYNLSQMNQIQLFDASGTRLNTLNEAGTPAGPFIFDDGNIPIPMGAQSFYFFGTDYGATNNIQWNSNNALIFGGVNPHLSLNIGVSQPDLAKANAILLGNYDRSLSRIYVSNYNSAKNLFSITKIIVFFANFYADTTNLDQGKLQIRLIREYGGRKRQWVEVTILSAVEDPGYSNNPSVTYTTADINGNPCDTNSNPMEPAKNSPWDITNGSQFLNLLGSLYSTSYPATGTTILYESDALGYIWTFRNHAYMNV